MSNPPIFNVVVETDQLQYVRYHWPESVQGAVCTRGWINKPLAEQSPEGVYPTRRVYQVERLTVRLESPPEELERARSAYNMRDPSHNDGAAAQAPPSKQRLNRNKRRGYDDLDGNDVPGGLAKSSDLDDIDALIPAAPVGNYSEVRIPHSKRKYQNEANACLDAITLLIKTPQYHEPGLIVDGFLSNFYNLLPNENSDFEPVNPEDPNSAFIAPGDASRSPMNYVAFHSLDYEDDLLFDTVGYRQDKDLYWDGWSQNVYPVTGQPNDYTMEYPSDSGGTFPVTAWGRLYNPHGPVMAEKSQFYAENISTDFYALTGCNMLHDRGFWFDKGVMQCLPINDNFRANGSYSEYGVTYSDGSPTLSDAFHDRPVQVRSTEEAPECRFTSGRGGFTDDNGPTEHFASGYGWGDDPMAALRIQRVPETIVRLDTQGLPALGARFVFTSTHPLLKNVFETETYLIDNGRMFPLYMASLRQNYALDYQTRPVVPYKNYTSKEQHHATVKDDFKTTTVHYTMLDAEHIILRPIPFVGQSDNDLTSRFFNEVRAYAVEKTFGDGTGANSSINHTRYEWMVDFFNSPYLEGEDVQWADPCTVNAISRTSNGNAFFTDAEEFLIPDYSNYYQQHGVGFEMNKEGFYPISFDLTWTLRVEVPMSDTDTWTVPDYVLVTAFPQTRADSPGFFALSAEPLCSLPMNMLVINEYTFGDSVFSDLTDLQFIDPDEDEDLSVKRSYARHGVPGVGRIPIFSGLTTPIQVMVNSSWSYSSQNRVYRDNYVGFNIDRDYNTNISVKFFVEEYDWWGRLLSVTDMSTEVVVTLGGQDSVSTESSDGDFTFDASTSGSWFLLEGVLNPSDLHEKTHSIRAYAEVTTQDKYKSVSIDSGFTDVDERKNVFRVFADDLQDDLFPRPVQQALCNEHAFSSPLPLGEWGLIPAIKWRMDIDELNGFPRESYAISYAIYEEAFTDTFFDVTYVYWTRSLIEPLDSYDSIVTDPKDLFESQNGFASWTVSEVLGKFVGSVNYPPGETDPEVDGEFLYEEGGFHSKLTPRRTWDRGDLS